MSYQGLIFDSVSGAAVPPGTAVLEATKWVDEPEPWAIRVVSRVVTRGPVGSCGSFGEAKLQLVEAEET